MEHEDWVEVLKKHLKRTQLEAHDFPHGPVTVTMQDGSFFCWYDAFEISDLVTGWVYVFTEHYGYHAFESEMVSKVSGPTEPE